MLTDASWLELESAATTFATSTAQLGRRVDVDAHELIEHRGLTPRGTMSANGSCRLLPTVDGWVAMTLNRPDDWDVLPALLGVDVDAGDWDAVAVAVTSTVGAELEPAGAELGLALAVVPAKPPPVDRPARILPTGSGSGRGIARVVDLSALWAGPLCAWLLGQAGADVLTVESTARRGSAREYEPHRLVSLDFTTTAGRAELHRLVDAADVVITAARPRALHGLGLDPVARTQRNPGLTWVAISAYGVAGPGSNRVGYGDDTAVAGGLVGRGTTPSFVGDAIADPITGLYAAVAALEVAAAGGGVVDISLRDAAAYVAGAPR